MESRISSLETALDGANKSQLACSVLEQLLLKIFALRFLLYLANERETALEMKVNEQSAAIAAGQ